MNRSKHLLAALTAALVLPDAVAGQGAENTEAAAALALVREAGAAPAASAVLMQERSARPAAELDAFADSLIALATSYRTGQPPSHRRAANAASMALLMAGHPGHHAERRRALAARGLDAPVAYPHAFEALERIALGARDPGLRGGVLYLMSQLPETGRVVSLLERLAGSSVSGLPSPAVQCLSTELGDQGRAALRRLYESDSVVDPTARDNLEALAYGYGWTRGP